MMPKKNVSPTVDLLDLQDNLSATVCRVKALAHSMRAVWEHGVDADIADGYLFLFSDTITLLDAANEGVQALCDVDGQDTSLPAKVVSFS
jgi:formylmethanofuran:tetrahydromethanopterin formyltransferase